MRRTSVGPRLRVGSYELTFVENTEIELRQFRSATVVNARKRPAALLVRHRGATFGLGMDGTPLTPAELEAYARLSHEEES